MHRIEETLMKVAAFAADAHHGQVRKYVDEPYIEHPVRVMYTCMNYGLSSIQLSAALLHDVIEDTKVTEDELLGFLGRTYLPTEANEILSLVKELTDVYVKEDYPHWNRRIRKAAELERLKLISPEAQTIKYADILDNSTAILSEDVGFAKVLLLEYQQQLQSLTRGDQSLRNLVLQKVENGLATLSQLN